MWLPSAPCPGGGSCVSVVCLCLALSTQRLAEPGIPQPESAHVTLILCTCIGLLVCLLIGMVSSHIWLYSDEVNAWKCDVGKVGGYSKTAVGKREEQDACSVVSQTSVLWTFSRGLFPGPAATLCLKAQPRHVVLLSWNGFTCSHAAGGGLWMLLCTLLLHQPASLSLASSWPGSLFSSVSSTQNLEMYVRATF